MDFQIQEPQKKEFKFNEVVSLTDVKPYVLRFWETEFIQINPVKNDNGDKIYAKRDILVIKTIKKLLFTDKLSIPEAKNVLDKELDMIEAAPVETTPEEVVDVKEQSKDLKMALEEIINAHSLTTPAPAADNSNTVEPASEEFSSEEETLNVEPIEAQEEAMLEVQPEVEVTTNSREYAKRSTSLANKLKLEFKTHNRELSNQDIVNLVNSKRKLAKLLGQIETLEEKYNWA